MSRILIKQVGHKCDFIFYDTGDYMIHKSIEEITIFVMVKYPSRTIVHRRTR